MITKKILLLAERLISLGSINLIIVAPDVISGYCPISSLGKLSVFCVDRGYFLKFKRSPSNPLTADFTIDLLS